MQYSIATNYVSHTGMYPLHEGEKVISKGRTRSVEIYIEGQLRTKRDLFREFKRMDRLGLK